MPFGSRHATRMKTIDSSNIVVRSHKTAYVLVACDLGLVARISDIKIPSYTMLEYDSEQKPVSDNVRASRLMVCIVPDLV